jgi:hypothetical protein
MGYDVCFSFMALPQGIGRPHNRRFQWIWTVRRFVFPVVAGYLVVTLPDKSLDFNNVFLFFSAAALAGTFFVAFLKEKMIPIDENESSLQAVDAKSPKRAVDA